MHSHYPFDYVLKLSVNQTTKLLIKAVEKQSEEKAWQLYLSKYPYMSEENYVPFEKFYNPQRGKEEAKSAEDILAEVKKLLDSHEWG